MPLRKVLLIALTSLLFQPAGRPQTASSAPTAASAPTAVPALVPYSGIAIAGDGKAITGKTGITFLIFKEEAGGEPLWVETQTVAIDSAGHYKVQLGATSASGLPADLFATGEARWLEVQIAGLAPQPRTLIASVPYALKAGDATTLGGLPASAFALAGAGSLAAAAAPSVAAPNAVADVTTTGGTSGYLPVFSGAATVVDSAIFQDATGIGIGTAAPAALLDVNGAIDVRGLLSLESAGVATATAGQSSDPLAFLASAYNSSTKAATTPEFELKAEVSGNNTTAPAATLNLLYGNGSAPAETGLSIASNGVVKFATGQTFPGSGTITGVTAGTGLTGGGTSGTVTLKVDTTKVPELGTSNSFAGTQTITSGNLNLSSGNLNLPATTSANSGVIDIGAVPFLHDYTTATASKQWGPNVFVGGAGNFTTTGFGDIGIGWLSLKAVTTGYADTALGNAALDSNTTGYQSTAVGFGALALATSGAFNTAVGGEALNYEVTGSSNTAVGSFALSNDTSGSNNTAVGSSALINQSNASLNTALGSFSLETNTTGGQNTAVGANSLAANTTGAWNDASGYQAMTSNLTGSDDTASGAEALNKNTTGSFNEANGYQSMNDNTTGSENTAVGAASLYTNTTGSFLTAVGYYSTSSASAVVNNSTALGAYATVGQSNSLILGQTTDGKPGTSYVNVGIGTPTPRSVLEASVSAPGALGPVLTLTNSGAGASAIDFNTSEPAADSTYTPSTRILAYNNAGSNQIAFQSRSAQGLQSNLVVSDNGSVYVPGALDAGAANLRIDDPLDPQNKSLVHASVESSEMMNIYSGNVTTDELGLATVTLPAWFEAENTDFRYQLTVIGQFAQAIIKQKVANGSFQIMTNASHVEVSWQITAVRQDSYAKAHPLVVEQLKPASELSGASHPEFAQPASAVNRTFERPATPPPAVPQVAAPTPLILPRAARPLAGAVK